MAIQETERNAMRFIAVLRASEMAGFPPPALLEGIAKLGAEATSAGVLVDTAGLLPSDTATQVSVRGGELSVTHGRPDESTMPVAAYAIYDVPTRDDVVEWTTRFMELHRRVWPGWTGESEIRQLIGPQG
jgi:hypothetical protein